MSGQPREQERFTYYVQVSRDLYAGYQKYETGAKSLKLEIIIQRTIEIRENFCAYLEGHILRRKTDKQTTRYDGNALWNGLGYKTKKEWEEIIEKYETIGQLERDFIL